MLTLTVSQLNRYVNALFEENETLQDLYIKAEVSNFTYHTPSGHMYFSLKDSSASVQAVMFRGHAQRLKFMPEDGMAVLVRGNVSLYEKTGSYQIYVTDMQPDGAGAMAVAVRQLRDKLEKEGLFKEEYKKPLPPYPQTIGVITAETGAALGDILQVLGRRYPIAKVLLYPALVQGEGAVASLVQAVQGLDGQCDVMILGRGGGSMEDLWAFQDEMLARVIFMAKTPIISAVGHEMDVTICDMVADQRAPTPSAAAELATPSKEQLLGELAYRRNHLRNHGKNKLGKLEEKMTVFLESPALRYPTYAVEQKRKQLDFLSKNLYNIIKQEQKERRTHIEKRAALLESLSPFAVLSRGYALVMKKEKAVRSVHQLEPGDKLSLRFSDGIAVTTVDTTEKKEVIDG